MPATRVLIAFHTLHAEGLQQILKDSFVVVGIARNREQAILMTDALKPSVLLMDADLAEPDGVDVLEVVRTAAPMVRIVLVSRKTHGLALRRAVTMGVGGLVLTQQPHQELCDAIRIATRGGTYIAPSLKESFAWMGGGRGVLRRDQRSGLTPRQQQVLQLIAEGRTNKEMARLLRITVKTVEFHRALLMRELGMRTVAELSRFAMHQGIVGPSN